MQTTTETCPECAASIPVHPGFTIWCDQCDWNLEPEPVKEKGLFAPAYRKLGEKMTNDLFQSVLRSGELVMKWRAPIIAAYALATFVHLFGLTLLYVAFAFIGRTIPHINLILLIFGFACLPRIPKLGLKKLSRETCPELYKLMDEIAVSLGSKPVGALSAVSDYNAFFTRARYKKSFKIQRIIGIGLPLFHVLDPQERVALLAHEMAHNVNGDATRGFYVNAALHTLRNWYDMLTSDEGDMLYLLRHVFFLPRALISLLEYSIVTLVYRDSQTAEYYADQLSAKVAGVDAVLSTLNKVHYSGVFVSTYYKLNEYRYTNNFYEELVDGIKRMPQREHHRLEMLQQRRLSRVDASHPPTIYRKEYIRQLGYEVPLVQLSKERSRKIDEELASAYKDVNRDLLHFLL